MPPPASSSAPRPRIGLVEDEPDLRANMLDYLQAMGFSAWGVESAEACYRRLLVDPVDVVLLDLGLPGEDGFTAVRHLRQIPGLGLIIVSARQTVDDRLNGLNSGADLYLVKPVDLRELVASIEALGRRLNLGAPPERGGLPEPTPAGTDYWRLNQETWEISLPDGRKLSLTALEYKFLYCLAQANGKTVDKRQVASELWGASLEVDFNRIDVMLARLRKKCQSETGQALPLKTVTAYGYALTAPCILE